MATYAELLTIATTDDAFRRRVKVACIVACDVIRLEAPATTNHTARVAWSKATLADPDTAASKMVLAVLAQNRASSAAVIQAADDATVQTAVNAAVDLLT